ncbi:MAG TPA: c-type cytochrome [Bryobacteraceae bacterium]|jgi:cytochrome c|nr:c-type cytochrome [Bryobacteraceae bacterium]
MIRNRPLTFLIVLGFSAWLAYVGSGSRPLLAQNDPGRQSFEKRCTGCHALDTEKAGPRLRGVYGRRAGSIPSFPYSEALRKSAITWSGDALDKWLTDPDAFIPDNDMAFRVTNPEERAAIIGYLKELSGK